MASAWWILLWPLTWFLFSALVPDEHQDGTTLVAVLFGGPAAVGILLAVVALCVVGAIPFWLGKALRKKLLGLK